MKGNFFGLMKKHKAQSDNLVVEKDTNLIYDLKPNSGCDYHRITLPIQDCTPILNLRNDVLVFNRMYTRGIGAVKEMKKQGMKIVVDWDDFISLEEDHYLYQIFKSRHFTESAIELINLADVITVTTELLAAALRPYHRNIVVIRNALPFDKLQFTRSMDFSSSTDIVWAGGASHANDLKTIKQAFNGELLTIAGYEDLKNAPKGSHQELSGNEWYKVSRDFPTANLVPAIKDVSKYMQLYDGHKIAIAPLTDNFFNRCKSNLKVLEAGAKGLPIVCSKVLPYLNPVDQDVVLYAENKHQWYTQINKLLKDPHYARAVGEKLAAHVRLHYNMDDANELRRQVYESL